MIQTISAALRAKTEPEARTAPRNDPRETDTPKKRRLDNPPGDGQEDGGVENAPDNAGPSSTDEVADTALDREAVSMSNDPAKILLCTFTLLHLFWV